MKNSRRIALLIFILWSLMAMSCDDKGDNFIDGSLVKNYNISYKDVQARLYSDSLSIEYVNKNKVAALRVTINTNRVKLAKGKTYDLAKYGSVTRYEGELPKLESGEFTLDEFNEKDGALVEGSFHAKFVSDNEGSQTLRGEFSVELKIADI